MAVAITGFSGAGCAEGNDGTDEKGGKKAFHGGDGI